MILTVLSASCAGIIQCLSFCDWLLSLGSVSLLVYCSFQFFLSFLLYISSCVPQCVCGGQRRSELSQFILFFSHGSPRNWTHMVRVWHQVPPTHWAILLFPHFFFLRQHIVHCMCILHLSFTKLLSCFYIFVMNRLAMNMVIQTPETVLNSFSFVVGYFMSWGFSVLPSLSWNLLCRPNWPHTQICLPLPPSWCWDQGMCHHTWLFCS